MNKSLSAVGAGLKPAPTATPFSTASEDGAHPLPAWVHLAALVAVSVVAYYVARGMWGWTYDDAFILYRYARNFAGGLGMVYNPGEHFLGASSVGYTLLLAALHLVAPGADFLTLGSAVSAGSLWALGVLVWTLGARTRAPLAGLLAALVTVANPLVLQSWGGEMPLLLPLIVGAILAYDTRREVLTGALLGLGILVRYDSVVLLGLIGLHYLWTRRRVPLALAAACLLVLAPWMVYSLLFFGSPLPGTLEAKIAQPKAGWPYFLSGAISWMSASLGPGPARALTFVLAPGGALALAVDAWRRRPVVAWGLLLGWAGLFTAGYTALRVSFYNWYAVPAAVGVGILVAWGVAGLAGLAAALGRAALAGRQGGANRPGGPGPPSWLRPALGGALALAVLALLVPPLVARVRSFDDNFMATDHESDLYRRAGDWLAAQGGATVSAAYLEVGEIGYYGNARIVDLLGLITPGAAAHVPAHDYGWAVQRYAPEYYLENSRFDPLLTNLQREPWFAAAYSRVATFADHRRNDPTVYRMVVYRRKPGVALPPPLRPVLAQWVSQQPWWLVPGAPAGAWAGQTFTAPAPNLNALAVLAGKPHAATGSLVLHLRRSLAGGADLRRVVIPLDQIGDNSWVTFRFDPLPDSAGQQYVLALELAGRAGTPPPLALWYATDDLLAGGRRYVGTQPQGGDLCLRAYVPDSGP